MHQNYAIQNVQHRARLRAKGHRTSLPGPFIEKQYRVLGMRALIPPSSWFVCTVHDAQCNSEESP